MKRNKFGLLRVALIVVVVIVAAGVTGESRSTKADPLDCFLEYTFAQMSCGVPETCDYGDIECRMRNQPKNDCLDRAAAQFFDCIGAGKSRPPLEP